MSNQQVILVDKNNRKLGVKEKISVHKEGKLHRAFSIFIFNSRAELLIQQRAKTKYHSGGLWSNTVCSHPKPKETYRQAIHRRLKEEMGFDCQMKKLFCFIYKASFENSLIENEYDCIFIGKFDGKPEPNAEEIMGVKWVSLKKLKQDIIKQPDKYSVWLKVVLKRIKYKQIKKKLKVL